LAAASLAGVAALAAAYAGTSSAGRIDNRVDGWLIRHSAHHMGLVRAMADLGGPVPVAVATVPLVVGLVRLGRGRGALLAALSPLGASALTELVLKPLIGRTHSGGVSFPSGHATGLGSVLAVVVVLAVDQRPPRLPGWAQWVVGLATGVLAVAGCAALVAAQYHYASDTLGGIGVAVASVLILALVVDGWFDRRAEAAEVAARRGARPPAG
jgi:membrane-associated phospholipid phosphatase